MLPTFSIFLLARVSLKFSSKVASEMTKLKNDYFIFLYFRSNKNSYKWKPACRVQSNLMSVRSHHKVVHCENKLFSINFVVDNGFFIILNDGMFVVVDFQKYFVYIFAVPNWFLQLFSFWKKKCRIFFERTLLVVKWWEHVSLYSFQIFASFLSTVKT